MHAQASFGELAFRIGAVTREALARARRAQRRRGGSLQRILVAQGALEPEVASFVRSAWRLARTTCRWCGREPDTARGVGCGACPKS